MLQPSDKGRRTPPMKVTGTGGLSQTSGAKPARAGGGEDFRIVARDAPAAPSAASSVSSTASVMGVDALIALQDVGSPLERRRRSVARAGHILDVLDRIKVALLEGELSQADLERLAHAVRDERLATEDPKLEALLDEIETRAAVELAKLEARSRAA